MNCCVVSVATTPYFQRGQRRLLESLVKHCADRTDLGLWSTVPPMWPSHARRPYAFKAFALQHAAKEGYRFLLWCDACIALVADLQPIWDYAAQHGAWISKNGWSNYQWTAEHAYRALRITPEENRAIDHVVAGAFALDTTHLVGAAILHDYDYLAAHTDVFAGPKWNANNLEHGSKPGAAPCGPPDVLGHRHDQTALSVLAWRYGVPLTSPPEPFSYSGGETDRTILVADGSYK